MNKLIVKEIKPVLLLHRTIPIRQAAVLNNLKNTLGILLRTNKVIGCLSEGPDDFLL